MRQPVLILLTGLALAAAACATVEPTVSGASGGGPAGSDAAPVPITGHDWFFHQDDAEARLVYGLAESDDMRLALDCTRASGRLVLSALGGPKAKPEIHVDSGGETARFRALSEPSQLHDGVFLTAEAAADAPVFQRFRRLGWMALWQASAREAYAPQPGSTPNIERFFAFCG
jgi:hypothetical protein